MPFACVAVPRIVGIHFLGGCSARVVLHPRPTNEKGQGIGQRLFAPSGVLTVMSAATLQQVPLAVGTTLGSASTDNHTWAKAVVFPPKIHAWLVRNAKRRLWRKMIGMLTPKLATSMLDAMMLHVLMDNSPLTCAWAVARQAPGGAWACVYERVDICAWAHVCMGVCMGA